MKAYFDNGATTKTDPIVVKEVIKYLSKDYGNASSVHSFGKTARKAVEKSRKILADKINCLPEEIIFTSGGTESDNLAIIGVAMSNKSKGNHIITSNIEHPAVSSTMKYLENNGFKITILKVDNEGFINPKDVLKAVTKKTILISIMHANNEIGTIQPIKEIGEIAKSKKVLFHTDAVQSFTKTELDVKKINVDLISLSAHKIHGPKGVGGLYIKKGVKISPLIYGGGQENGIRTGTENVPGIVGFSKAVEISNEKNNNEMKKLRDYIIEKILEISGSRINGSIDHRLVNNINCSFRGIEGEALLALLDDKGIAVSTGSACSSNKLEPSHVIKAIKVPNIYVNGTIRITISKYTNKKEADYLIKNLKSVVKRLSEMSPLWKNTQMK